MPPGAPSLRPVTRACAPQTSTPQPLRQIYWRFQIRHYDILSYIAQRRATTRDDAPLGQRPRLRTFYFYAILMTLAELRYARHGAAIKSYIRTYKIIRVIRAVAFISDQLR